MSTLKFSQDRYNQFNDFGIKTATSFLESQGYRFINATESYKSHDFIVEKDGKNYKIEVEVSRIWKQQPFPFKNMTVPYRKKDSQAHFFIQTNVFGNYLNFCPMSIVKSSDIIMKDTCYTTNEKFFNVSLSKLEQFIFQNDAWCPV